MRRHLRHELGLLVQCAFPRGHAQWGIIRELRVIFLRGGLDNTAQRRAHRGVFVFRTFDEHFQGPVASGQVPGKAHFPVGSGGALHFFGEAADL